MPAISTIVIDDGQATPVSHTFEPVKSVPSCVWRTEDAALPVIGQMAIAMSDTTARNITKFRLTLSLPAMEETSGANASGYTAAPQVAHTLRADLVLFAHGRSTSDQRKDLVTLLRNALAHAQVEDSFVALKKPY